MFCFVIFTQYRKNKISSWVNIGYLVSAIKKMQKCEVIVKAYDFDEVEKACQEMNEMNPSTIGLSMLQENFNINVDFANRIKHTLDEVIIVAGNVEPTVGPKSIIENYECIDIVVVGEAEETIIELLDVIDKDKPLQDCAGIYYRENDYAISTKQRPLLCNLDSLAFPDRDFGDKNNTLFSVIGSRGCTGKCTFCDANAIYKHYKFISVRERSIVNIVDEVEYLIDQYNCQYIVFVDSTFCNSLDHPEFRLEELYKEFTKRSIWILFYLNARTEQIKGEFLANLIKLKQVGLNGVQLGLESGNSHDLKLYGKYASPLDNLNAIKLLKENCIPYDCGFINFNPYTTIDRLKENIHFLRASAHCVTPHFLMTRLSIYSGSPITKKIITDNLFAKNDEIPISERYLYNFQNKEIETIFCSAKHCYSYLETRDYQWLNNIFEQYRKYGKEDKLYFQNIDRMILLDEFSVVYNEISLSLFEKIILLIENGVGEHRIVYENLKEDIKNANVKIGSYITKLDTLQNELSLSLYKKNKLIVYR